MNNAAYILDSNVFIVAWNNYYSPDFCEGYFTSIERLGEEGRLAIPQKVYEEIKRQSDALYEWIHKSQIPVCPITEGVQKSLRKLYQKDPKHRRLADTSKNRSMADPWVIAHAMEEDAVVVTKEEEIVTPGSTKVKIPNVCRAMGVRCIHDFEFIREVNIKMWAKISSDVHF